ncbi:hypothetical protein [Streptomyces sp. NPDC001502]|uniref:hypothetical protein n=1 Tax=Streptomyces sp. NPDC001502 TaxID=3364578 RepID=UPI0036777CDF
MLRSALPTTSADPVVDALDQVRALQILAAATGTLEFPGERAQLVWVPIAGQPVHGRPAQDPPHDLTPDPTTRPVLGRPYGYRGPDKVPDHSLLPRVPHAVGHRRSPYARSDRPARPAAHRPSLPAAPRPAARGLEQVMRCPRKKRHRCGVNGVPRSDALLPSVQVTR